MSPRTTAAKADPYDVLRQRRIREDQAAQEAVARQEATRRAERALRAQELALTDEAWHAYRAEVVNPRGGINKGQNEAAQAFVDAVRAGDGAGILTTWCRWRLETARRYGEESTLLNGEQRAQIADDPHQQRHVRSQAYWHDRVPDFAGDLAKAHEVLERDAQAEGGSRARAWVDARVADGLAAHDLDADGGG